MIEIKRCMKKNKYYILPVKSIITFYLFFTFDLAVHAQKITVQEYINQYKHLAVEEMKRSGVPADITLAQGVLETENGNSILVKKSNNHFGIKCKETWKGEKVYHDDDERGECFRKYNSAEDSYRDHSDFLRTRPHYAFLFTLDPTDYKAWATGLKKAGYATNPNYPKILIKTIEDYHLNDLSVKVYKGLPIQDEIVEKKSEEVVVINTEIKKNNIKSEDPKSCSVYLTNVYGLKAVFADSGYSLLAIASMHNIPFNDLLKYNDLHEETFLSKSQWLYLESKRKSGVNRFYKTAGYESVYDIAQSNALQLKKLIKYNDFNQEDIISPNSIVFLNKKHRLTKSEKSNIALTHLVKPKEALYGISKKYNVSVDEIKGWNGLQSNELNIGQELIISK